MTTANADTEATEEVSESMTGKSASGSNPLDIAVQKAQDIRSDLRTGLIERDTEIDLVMLSIIARQHGVFVGTGGVAKSMTIDSVMDRIDATKFKILLRKSMPVEEVFGPLSIKGLENDEFRYITKGRAAEANVVFKDEIYKANAVLLNASLMLINERIFINDGIAVKVPLWSLFGASNELPNEPELAAFRDRFAWHKEVRPVSTDDGFKAVIRGAMDRTQNPLANQPKIIMSIAEVEELQQAQTQVKVPDPILNSIATMRRRAEGEFDLIISVRRYIAGIELCKAQAVMNGRDAIIEDDLTLFQHTLWTDLEDADKAYEVTLDYAGKVARVTQQLRTAYEPYHNDLATVKGEVPSTGAISQELAGKVATIQMNLKNVATQVTKQIEEARTDQRDVSELESLLAEVNNDRDYIRNEILG